MLLHLTYQYPIIPKYTRQTLFWEILGIMAKSKKIVNNLDVHVHFDDKLSEYLRFDREKEQRTFAQQIRYIVGLYYADKENA